MVNHYIPPKTWSMESSSQGQWASINRPDSGSRYEQELEIGVHPIQLYSMGTPNGQKVTIMLEELLQAGFQDAEYNAYLINISQSEQFSSGFVEINPNSKIPAMVDYSGTDQIKVFESGNILLYLAEKFSHLLPSSLPERTEVMNWLFWLQGSAPYLGGGFGHFYAYAPEKFEYPINRFTMEVKRQLDVLDKQLSKHKYIASDEYSIADIAIWPWYGNLVLSNLYNAAEFLEVKSYQNVMRWAEMIAERPAVKRGRIVNRIIGEEWERVPTRHSAVDIDSALVKQP